MPTSRRILQSKPPRFLKNSARCRTCPTSVLDGGSRRTRAHRTARYVLRVHCDVYRQNDPLARWHRQPRQDRRNNAVAIRSAPAFEPGPARRRTANGDVARNGREGVQRSGSGGEGRTTHLRSCLRALGPREEPAQRAFHAFSHGLDEQDVYGRRRLAARASR